MTDHPAHEQNAGAPMRTVLFVCTGNTCRSPMAQAIADDLLRSADASDTLFIASAGVMAGEGMPATPEALVALSELGVAEPSHRSTPLNPAMIEKAEAVFGLTASHVDAIRAMAPGSAHKVHLLDPEGADVPDPIGYGLDVYISTARTLRALVVKRLLELGVRLDAEASL